MEAAETKDLMIRLAAGVGQRTVALQCECENLETVYVMVGEDGNLLVTDNHKTFYYLDQDDDATTYVPLESLDMAAARLICEELCVELKPAPPDGYPSVECIISHGQSISEAVERVAEAVDRIFELALRKAFRAVF